VRALKAADHVHFHYQQDQVVTLLLPCVIRRAARWSRT
jgi:hypothetical protein